MNKLISTNALLFKIRNGDRNSFNEFFRLYYVKFLRISLQYVKGYNNAEEIVSDVFFKILSSKRDLSKMERVEAYLFKMVKNQTLDFLKKKANKSLELHDELESDYIETTGDLRVEIDGNELQAIIENCFEQFPPKRKLIYKLVKEQKLRYKEVSEILSISPKTVENHLVLAMKNLRKVVQLYYQDLQDQTPVKSINRRKSR